MHDTQHRLSSPQTYVFMAHRSSQRVCKLTGTRPTDTRSCSGSGAESIQRCAQRRLPQRHTLIPAIVMKVFEGVDMSNEETCIIKVLKPVAKKKIRREIKILRNLTGGPNIVGLLDVVHDPPSRSNSLIMEYVHNTDWKELFPSFSELEIKHYIFQLLDVCNSSFCFDRA